MRSRKRRLALVAAAVVGGLAAPASAQALTVSVTGDDGVPQAITGQTIRNMAPQLTVTPGPGEAYAVSVTGPGGQAATVPAPCSTASTPRTITYQGNGAYTVDIVGYGPGSNCTGGAATKLTFTIGAGVALSADPNSPLLTRQPGEFATIEHRLPITGNPGAGTYDVLYSSNPALAPDGTLVGPARNAFVDTATATIPLRFTEPGSYYVIARARAFGGAATPWTAPLALKVFAPFDFSSSSFPDSRGPSYRLRVRLRETSARGRVKIEVARRWTGRASYRRLGTVRIRAGAFTKRFTLGRTGTYRIRYTFPGSATTAPGTVVEKVRIRRTVRVSAIDAADHVLTAAR